MLKTTSDTGNRIVLVLLEKGLGHLLKTSTRGVENIRRYINDAKSLSRLEFLHAVLKLSPPTIYGRGAHE